MDCQATREELMAGDGGDAGDAVGAAPLEASVREHLEGCAACAAFAARLRGIETLAAKAPIPPALLAAKERVLTAMRAQAAGAVPVTATLTGHPRSRFGLVAAVLAAAAMLALGVTLGAWLAPRPISVALRSDPILVVDLVDWNLELGRASPDDRRRVYTQRAPGFVDRTREAALRADDRELVDALMANGSWLKSHDEPLDEVGRFNDLADRVVERIESLRVAGDDAATARLAAAYAALVDEGVNANLDRALAQPGVAASQPERVDEATRDSSRHLEQLRTLLDRVPEGSRTGIERALANQARKIAADPRHKMPPGLAKKIRATQPATRKADD